MTGVAAAAGQVPHSGNVGWAVALAVVSTCCYAASAALQQREAAGRGVSPRSLMLRLARRPLWWLAILATVVGATLHIAALALGPLSLVQPLGVLTFVFALPLGAWLGGRVVTAREWGAAIVVALGLAVLLTAAPHHAPAALLAPSTIVGAAALVGAAAAALVVLAGRLPARAAPVGLAAAAATCFGFASGMARVAVTGSAPVLIASALAALGAVTGLGLAQLAYRDGGLGAPLATLNLIDPLVAVLLGVTLLGEPFPLTPPRVALVAVGLVATSIGIGMLAVAPRPGRPPAVHDPGKVAHVVR